MQQIKGAHQSAMNLILYGFDSSSFYSVQCKENNNITRITTAQQNKNNNNLNTPDRKIPPPFLSKIPRSGKNFFTYKSPVIDPGK